MFTEKAAMPMHNAATDLTDLVKLSGGSVNAVLVWKHNGDINLFLPNGKQVKPGTETADTQPARSMRDHGLPIAAIMLINGTPKYASINGTCYEIVDDSTLNLTGSTVKNQQRSIVQTKEMTISETAFGLLKIGGNSENGDPARTGFQETQRQPKNRQATDLTDLVKLSGGSINAVLVWKHDGDVDLFLPNGKQVKPGTETTADTQPARSMRGHGPPVAAIMLINGTPKYASINGTRYEIEDDSVFGKIGTAPPN